METYALIFAFTIYKVTSLSIGALFVWFGYRLFCLGIWGGAGDFEGQFSDNKLVLKQGAPGTFFVFFGAAVVVATILNGFDFNLNSDGSVNNIEELRDNDDAPNLED